MTATAALPRVERDPDDDHPVFFHHCKDSTFDSIGAKLPLGADGWQWQPDGSLTPSIQCVECGLHGWWTGSWWRS